MPISNKQDKHINWTNALFLTITPIVGIVGSVILAYSNQIPLKTIWLALCLIIMSGISVTAGYHRLFSHASYKASWPVRLIFLLFAASAFEGSALEWSTDHRNHHRYTDTPKDPYNFKQGFWYAHIGWLITLDLTKRNFNNVNYLKQDLLVRWQHKFFLPIAIIMGFVLPMYVAGLWGNAWGGLIVAGALRISVLQHLTFCINSFCHTIGKQPYSERNSAKDNWFTALLTFGEGYHNFHHTFPVDYRNGIRFFHYDPTKWLIRAMMYLGLTSHLKTIPLQKIVQFRLDRDRANFTEIVRDQSTLLYQSIIKLYSELELLKNKSDRKKLLKQLKHLLYKWNSLVNIQRISGVQIS